MPAPAPATATATPTMPATCSIKGLVAFGPGYHKNELYSEARSNQVADNYAASGGRPVPLAKIGHDKQQQFARSLGFLNVGVVTRLAKVGNGCWEVDIDNVPTEVGGKVNAGLIRGASVELKNRQRDPRDPAKEFPGEIITGISLLGNEQPCVQNWPEHLRARAIPRATFADGTPVPANYEMTRWLNMASEVSEKIVAEQGGEFSADRRTVKIRGRNYSAQTLCFSDIDSDPNPDPGPIMTPEQEAALQAAGFTPEQIAAMKAALPGAGAAAVPPPNPPATNPTMSADLKTLSDKFSAFAEDCTKRFGALEALGTESQKKTEEAAMAAFSAQVDLDLNGEWVDGKCVNPRLADRIEPKRRAKFKEALMIQFAPGTKAFASEADRVAEYGATIKGYMTSLPVNKSLVTAPAIPANPSPKAELTAEHRASLSLTPMGQSLLRTLEAAK